jgi:hypothetical protein
MCIKQDHFLMNPGRFSTTSSMDWCFAWTTFVLVSGHGRSPCDPTATGQTFLADGQEEKEM